jgi:hypothetical protein
MDPLPTIFEDDCIDYSELSDNMLNDHMDDTINKLNKEFLNITKRIKYINDMFYKLYSNDQDNMGMSFIEHELLEERMDGLIYRYQKTKELLKKGRLIRYYKEEQEKEKKAKLNELRYARNTLAHYGINTTNSIQ